MSEFYSDEMIVRTAALIEERFHVAADYSNRLAVAALCVRCLWLPAAHAASDLSKQPYSVCCS